MSSSASSPEDLDVQRCLVLGRKHEDREDVSVSGIAAVPVLPAVSSAFSTALSDSSRFNNQVTTSNSHRLRGIVQQKLTGVKNKLKQ